MQVYLATFVDYDDFNILGIFSKEEDAILYCKKDWDKRYDVIYQSLEEEINWNDDVPPIETEHLINPIRYMHDYHVEEFRVDKPNCGSKVVWSRIRNEALNGYEDRA